MLKIVDAAGNIVPGATNLVSFEITGAASIIGVDNGNPTSHEDYQTGQRLAFHGRCLAIIQSKREAGDIRVTCRADGLKPASVELKARAPVAIEPTLP